MSKMRFILTLAVVLTLAGASAAFAQDAAPKLTVIDPIKDFGTVPKGTMLEWEFTLKNNGQKDLEIVSVQPACGCTVAEFDKVIKPGETGHVKASVDTTNFNGPIAKGISVSSSDPSTPIAQLTIRANVKPYVEAAPGYLRYLLSQGEARKQTTVLYSQDPKPFEVVRVEAPKDYIKVEYKKIEDAEARVNGGREGQNQWRVDVTVGGPEAPIGPIAEKVIIHTTSEFQPVYELSVTGLVRPGIMLSPPALNFGDVGVADPAATRMVTIKSTSVLAPEQFQVTKVESTTPSVIAEASATETPGTYELTVKVAEGAKAGEITGDLKVYTTDPMNPVVTIPVSGSVKGEAAFRQ
ncbi:MAG: DUF1573 domain-containing protein [Thermoanaerobaculia bacterium]